ncbi:TIGR03936 family radical SAM-associated protein, partial [bacterium]|nr:TIGR03936 family radical SAM-associated protein [bacterium]
RKTGLTFALEAGSEGLRQSINKYLDEQVFIANLSRVFAQGWERLKLYFMLGLPGEREEDITAISTLVRKILAAARRATPGRKRAPRLNLSLALFVPKPHTPFQWEGQLSRSEAKIRYKQLARELPPATGYRFGKVEEQELNKSYLEAVMARGDRRLWEVIHQAWARGARFDSWSEHFNFEIWSQAFLEKGIDPDDYALRERGVEEALPWDHLDTGVSRNFLKQERTRAQAGNLTPDCRPANCQGCGVADPKTCPLPPARELPAGIKDKVEAGPERESVRIRLRYQKTGDMRFIGHLDMVNLFRRAARRARLPLHYSIGFHPQPTLAFGPPLSLGFQGLAEWIDIGLDSWLDPRAIVLAMNQVLPPGIRLEAGREIPLNTPALSKSINAGRYFLNLRGVGEPKKFEERIAHILESKEILIPQWTKRGTICLDFRPAIVDLRLLQSQADPGIELTHSTMQPGSGKVSAIVAYLCQDQVEAWEVQVTRMASGYWHQGRIMTP